MFKEGDHPNYLYIILRGSVNVYLKTPEEERLKDKERLEVVEFDHAREKLL